MVEGGVEAGTTSADTEGMTVMNNVFFSFLVKCVCHLQKRQGVPCWLKTRMMEGAGSDRLCHLAAVYHWDHLLNPLVPLA